MIRKYRTGNNGSVFGTPNVDTELLPPQAYALRGLMYLAIGLCIFAVWYFAYYRNVLGCPKVGGYAGSWARVATEEGNVTLTYEVQGDLLRCPKVSATPERIIPKQSWLLYVERGREFQSPPSESAWVDLRVLKAEFTDPGVFKAWYVPLAHSVILLRRDQSQSVNLYWMFTPVGEDRVIAASGNVNVASAQGVSEDRAIIDRVLESQNKKDAIGAASEAMRIEFLVPQEYQP